jgi:hypothetical protein
MTGSFPTDIATMCVRARSHAQMIRDRDRYARSRSITTTPIEHRRANRSAALDPARPAGPALVSRTEARNLVISKR